MELHCHPEAPISIIEEASNTTQMKHASVPSAILPACPQSVSSLSPNIGEPSATPDRSLESHPVFSLPDTSVVVAEEQEYRYLNLINLSEFQFRSSGTQTGTIREKRLGFSLPACPNLAEDTCGTSQHHLATAHIGYTRSLALVHVSYGCLPAAVPCGCPAPDVPFAAAGCVWWACVAELPPAVPPGRTGAGAAGHLGGNGEITEAATAAAC